MRGVDGRHAAPAATSVLGCQRARQLTECLLVPLIRDLGEVSRQFQAHALARADRPAGLVAEALEEVADGNAQDPRDVEEPAGGNPVDAALVFVCLPVSDADELGELLLGAAVR